MVKNMSVIKITQIKSTIKKTSRQKDTIRALGLGKINKSVKKSMTPQLKGMLRKVEHLVIINETKA